MRTLCVIAVGCISLCLLWVCLPKHAPDWQTSLSQGLHNEVSSKVAHFVPVDVGGYTVYSVPNGIAQILDGHSKAELLPVLTALRKTANLRETDLLDEWTKIVSCGARGQRCDWLRTAGFWSGYQIVTDTAWTYSVPLYVNPPREPTVR